MSITDKIQRLKEGLASETDPDLILSTKAIISGIVNHHLNLRKDLALQRYEQHCKGCEFNVEDPVDDMRVEDKLIPELSGKMCNHCGGCVLSYKIRQSIKKCEFWYE